MKQKNLGRVGVAVGVACAVVLSGCASQAGDQPEPKPEVSDEFIEAAAAAFLPWAGDKVTEALGSAIGTGIEHEFISALGYLGVPSSLFESKEAAVLADIKAELEITNALLGDIDADINNMNSTLQGLGCTVSSATMVTYESNISTAWSSYTGFLKAVPAAIDAPPAPAPPSAAPTAKPTATPTANPTATPMPEPTATAKPVQPTPKPTQSAPAPTPNASVTPKPVPKPTATKRNAVSFNTAGYGSAAKAVKPANTVQTLKQQINTWVAKVLPVDANVTPIATDILSYAALIEDPRSQTGQLRSCFAQAVDVWKKTPPSPKQSTEDRYKQLQDTLALYYAVESRALIMIAAAANFIAGQAIGSMPKHSGVGPEEFGLDSGDGKLNKTTCEALASVQKPAGGASWWPKVQGAQSTCMTVYANSSGILAAARAKMLPQFQLVGFGFSDLAQPNPKAGQPGEADTIPAVVANNYGAGPTLLPTSLESFTAASGDKSCSLDPTGMLPAETACGPVESSYRAGSPASVKFATIDGWTSTATLADWSTILGSIPHGNAPARNPGVWRMKQWMSTNLGFADPGNKVVWQPNQTTASQGSSEAGDSQITVCVSWGNCRDGVNAAYHRFFDTNLWYPFNSANDIGQQLLFIAPTSGGFNPSQLDPSNLSSKSWYGNADARFWHDNKYLLYGPSSQVPPYIFKWNNVVSKPNPPKGIYAWPSMSMTEAGTAWGNCNVTNSWHGMNGLCGSVQDEAIDARFPEVSYKP